MSDHMRVAETAYRETMAELRLAEGGGFKAASQHRMALEAALEAAAPFIAAQAWEEGNLAGTFDPPTPNHITRANPYRSEQ